MFAAYRGLNGRIYPHLQHPETTNQPSNLLHRQTTTQKAAYFDHPYCDSPLLLPVQGRVSHLLGTVWVRSEGVRPGEIRSVSEARRWCRLLPRQVKITHVH